jgi:hypothetical protein
VSKLADAGMTTGEGWDDEITFNTQVISRNKKLYQHSSDGQKSTQWDSLVHWQDPVTKLAYNGIQVTKEALSVSTSSENQMPTLDHWHEKGGLVARGVLIDYKLWYEQKAVAEGKAGDDAVCHPFEGHRITIADIEAIAKEQRVEFRPGDVLIIRTGMTETFEGPTPSDFEKLQKVQLSGVDGTKETVKWLWNKHFAAVAGDSIAFEALPPLTENRELAAMEDLGMYSSRQVLFESRANLTTPFSSTPLAALDVWDVHR